MIPSEQAGLANSLWHATAHPAPAYPPLDGARETDVAIIGGGYTGLSAALHLAEAGVAVTVLEANNIGWGASGRNGGQINPGLKEDPDMIEARFGSEMGRSMVELSGGGADLVFSLIDRFGIDCDATRTGWLQLLHDKALFGGADARIEQWKRRGASLRRLSVGETAEFVGSHAYPGAVLDERGGSLHPLNYALGLAAAAKRLGAVLCCDSRASSLVQHGDRHVIGTAQGSLTARHVLLCTNGYTDGLAPPLARTVIPVPSIQVATAPLADDLRRAILPFGQHASDSRKLISYFRLDPQGRFIMGGRGAYGGTGIKSRMADLRKSAIQLYPQLRDVEWQFGWGGNVAMTLDHYPHLNHVGQGVIAALGYNGRGVAMATVLGKVLAEWALGRPERELGFPVTKLKPIPFHVFRKPIVSATIALYRLQDRLGL